MMWNDSNEMKNNVIMNNDNDNGNNVKNNQ